MDLSGGGGLDVAAHADVDLRGLLLAQRDDAGSGGGGYRDGGRDQQWLVNTAAAHHMLDRLHCLAGTDGDSIDGEFEPRL